METIDMTPSWQEITNVLIAILQNGSAEGKKIAEHELNKMAKAADLWNEHCKNQK